MQNLAVKLQLIFFRSQLKESFLSELHKEFKAMQLGFRETFPSVNNFFRLRLVSLATSCTVELILGERWGTSPQLIAVFHIHIRDFKQLDIPKLMIFEAGVPRKYSYFWPYIRYFRRMARPGLCAFWRLTSQKDEKIRALIFYTQQGY